MVGKQGYWWAMAGLVALLLLFYSTPDIRLWHQRVSRPPESLHAAAIAELLQRQEQGLVSLLNATTAPASAHALLTQIQLNHQMQQLVGSSGNPDPDLCRLQGGTSRRLEKKLLKWQPDEKRYLLVVCTSGQISNHIICLEKHMYFAALLNRTLVLPSPTLDYDYEKSLDVAHIRACLGAATIVSFAEFIAGGRGEMRLLCYMPGCYLDEEHEKKLKSVGLSWTSKTNAWPEEASIKKGYPSHPHATEIVAKFSCPDDVLAVGDLFYADVESEAMSQVGGPLQHSCKTIMRPNRLIQLTAERFLQTYLGNNFMAIHFRRHGFLKFCNVKNESCFFPIPQAASCISSTLKLSKPPVIYVSTDAAESETNLLQQLLEPRVPMIQRPQHDSKEKWDALLQRKGLLNESEVVAMLDKTICALSRVFIGTPGSTFTDDILRLRREWGKDNSCDCNLCQGQHPSYIAETD